MGRIDGDQHMPEEKPEQNHYSKESLPGSELWTNGLLCAFEYVKGKSRPVRSRSNKKPHPTHQANSHNMKKQVSSGIDASVQEQNDGYLSEPTSLAQGRGDNNFHSHKVEKIDGSHWVPIGWARISELVETVQISAEWVPQQFDFMDDEDDRTIADLAAPYWERPAGPVWWCHVAASHPHISVWLNNASWLHPAVSIALRDENRLISEKMKHLLYEVQ